MNSSTRIQPSLTNVYLVVTAGVALAVLYAIVDRPTPALVALFIRSAPVVAVGSWFRQYLRHSQLALPFDFGFFYLIGWIVLVPIYAKRVFLKRRWRRVGKMFGLALAPTIAGSIAAIAVASTR